MYLKVNKMVKDARIDEPAYLGDAGYDVYSPIDVTIRPGNRVKLGLKLRLEFDSNYVCMVQEKSGMANRLGIQTIGNVIDSSYRGEIHVILHNIGFQAVTINKGMKVAQLLFMVCGLPEIKYVEELSTSDRGVKGFGSSGK
jgi:dUTP pyrophosphatase